SPVIVPPKLMTERRTPEPVSTTPTARLSAACAAGVSTATVATVAAPVIPCAATAAVSRRSTVRHRMAQPVKLGATTTAAATLAGGAAVTVGVLDTVVHVGAPDARAIGSQVRSIPSTDWLVAKVLIPKLSLGLAIRPSLCCRVRIHATGSP